MGELLQEIGRVYVPFLLANQKAIANGHAEFEVDIDARRWTQPVFAYQMKCLEVLQQLRLDLTTQDRNLLDKVLSATGCEALFSVV